MLMLNPSQIRQLRLALGETLKEFASRMGVKPDCVVKWEQGRRHPRYAKLLELNDLLKKLQDERGLVLAQ